MLFSGFEHLGWRDGGEWKHGVWRTVYVVDAGMQCVFVVVKLKASVPPALWVCYPHSGEWI